jgi:hypothetical protein
MSKSASVRLASAAIAAVALSAGALMAGPAGAAVIAAQALVAPVTHAGPCPFEFQFKGKIVSNSPGVVKYRWIRSDGAIAPIQTLDFRERGEKFVTDTWTIGRTYGGWEAVRILSPNPLVSNHAAFKLVCKSPLVP